jgi:hypothetical protein
MVMTTDATTLAVEAPARESDAPKAPLWLRASVVDLVDLDFEAPIAGSQSADSGQLGELFRAAGGTISAGSAPDTPSSRIFAMLSADGHAS